MVPHDDTQSWNSSNLHKLITSITQNIFFLEKQGEKGELEKKIMQFDPKVVTQPGCGA